MFTMQLQKGLLDKLKKKVYRCKLQSPGDSGLQMVCIYFDYVQYITK